MALTDFLRINLPYGIELDESGKWFAFNREYKPLGWNTNSFIKYENYPIATKFSRMTENFLVKLGQGDELKRDESGKIFRVMLYNDATNPRNGKSHWNKYSKKLELLSKIEIPKQKY